MFRHFFVAILVIPGIASSAVAGKLVEARQVLIQTIEQVDVSARDPGAIESLAVREGQVVKKGDLLAQLDDAEARLASEQARLDCVIAAAKAEDTSAIRAAEEALTVARAELDRAHKSLAEFPNSVSQSEVERIQLAIVQAESKRRQLEIEHRVAQVTCELRQSELKLAELKLERRAIRSPLEGVVVEILRRPGEWVEPGEKIMRLIRMDTLRAEGFVDLEHLTPALGDAPVRVTVDLPGQGPTTFTGKVVFISPEINPVLKHARVWAEIPNPRMQLKPGLAAQMVIELP